MERATVLQDQSDFLVANDEFPTTAMEEPPTKFSSHMKPRILWPKNGAAQSILKSPSTVPPRKSAASITPLLSMHQKVVVEFTAEELSAFVFVCADLFL
jgi:hypothetical protein